MIKIATRTSSAAIAALLIAAALWWAALPSALGLVAAFRDETVAEVPLDRLVAAVAHA